MDLGPAKQRTVLAALLVDPEFEATARSIRDRVPDCRYVRFGGAAEGMDDFDALVDRAGGEHLVAAVGGDAGRGSAQAAGVVVDDTIHLLLAIHNSGARSMREAIVSGMTRVLPAITLTSVILVVGFGAFMMGDFVPNQNFGLLAVTILLSGYFFDVIFLPALLLVLSSRSSTLVATLGVQKGV